MPNYGDTSLYYNKPLAMSLTKSVEFVWPQLLWYSW